MQKRNKYGLRVFWRNRSTEDLWYPHEEAREFMADSYTANPNVTKVTPIGIGGQQVVGDATDLSLYRARS